MKTRQLFSLFAILFFTQVAFSQCPNIDGFTTLGEHNGHGYYLSNGQKTWAEAQAHAESIGGNLAAINTQAENDFIKSSMGNSLAFIGYSDVASEGTGAWANGDPVTLDLSFSNTDQNDFAVMNFWAGTWQLVNQWVHKEYIVETNCGGTNPGGCADNITGFTKLGDLNGHAYYLSSSSPTWAQAKTMAENAGGYLATMNDQAENDFLQGVLGNNLVFIGYNDAASEGTGAWANGDPVTLNLSFSNTDQNDFAIMNFWAGTWQLVNQWVHKPFIMEMNCGSGPATDCTFYTEVTIPFSYGPKEVYLRETASNFEFDYHHHINSPGTEPQFNSFLIDKTTGIASSAASGTDTKYTVASTFGGGATPTLSFSLEAQNGMSVLWTTNHDFEIPVGMELVPSYFSRDLSKRENWLYISGNYALKNVNGEMQFLFFVLKFDKAGNFISQHKLSGNTNFEATFVHESKDGGYYLSHNATTNHVTKVNPTGQEEWTRVGHNRVPLFMGESKNGEYAFLLWDDNTNNPPGAQFKIENIKLSDFTGGGNTGLPSNSVTSRDASYHYIYDSFSANGSEPGSEPIGNIKTDDGLVIFLKVFDIYDKFGPFKVFAVRFDNNLNMIWTKDVTSITAENLIGTSINGIYTDNSEFLLAQGNQTSFTFRKMADDGTILPICGNTMDLPDLTVSNITNLASSGTANMEVTFNFNLNNIGTVAATGAYDINMYLSSNDTYSADDILVGQVVTAATAVGTVADIPAAIAVPGNMANGDYFLLIVADNDNTITESNENNNMISTAFSIGTSGTGCAANIAGFSKLGEYSGHGYYLSTEGANWGQAKTLTENAGGYLVTLNNQAENDFVKSNLGNNMVHIGYNDLASEGTGAWANGETSILDLSSGNSAQNDFAVMNFWNGNWQMVNQWVVMPYVMEMGCDNQVFAAPMEMTQAAGLKLASIYPNPANDYITARILSGNDNEITFSIFNAQGQVQILKTREVTKGASEVEFEIHDLNPGIYFLSATGKNVNQIFRFSKVD